MNFNTNVKLNLASPPQTQDEKVLFYEALAHSSLSTVLVYAQSSSAIESRFLKLPPKLTLWTIISNYKEIIAFIEFVIDLIKVTKLEVKKLLEKFKEDTNEDIIVDAPSVNVLQPEF